MISPCPAGWVAMMLLGGVIVGLAIAAIVREVEARRKSPPE